MRLRQSTLKRWISCPLMAHLDDVSTEPRKSGSKAMFGTCIHAALEHYNKTGDVDNSVKLFVESWEDPTTLGEPEIDVWNKFTTYGGLRQRGIDILRAYHDRMRWEQRIVVAPEHRFLVPFGEHELTGTVDLVSVRQNHKGKQLLMIEDYKGNTKKPSVAELALNVQFCVDEATEALTRRGWLTHDQIVDGDEVLTLNQELDVAEWQPILSVHTFPTNKQLLVSIEQNGHSSLTTSDHRWPAEHVVSSQRGWRRERRVIPSNKLSQCDRVPCSAPVVNLPVVAKWSDAFVELVAWFWTEGHWTQTGASIGQSERVNPLKVQRIRGCLTAFLGAPVVSLHSERGSDGFPAWRERPGPDCIRFYLNQKTVPFLREVMSREKVVTSDFIADLTAAQLKLFIDTAIAADGTITSKGNRIITQSVRERLDPLQMACSLAGIRTSICEAHIGGTGPYAGRLFWRMALWEVRRHFVPRAVKTSMIEHTGTVWCPRTDNQTWLARRNGTVYFTGNTVYIYAAGQPEFWFGNGDGFPPIENAEWNYELLKDLPKRGMWVHLWDNAKELDAGGRTDDDFGRLYRLVCEIERAYEHEVFVPNIGDSCTFCDHSGGLCPVDPPSRDYWENLRPEVEETSWL